MEHRGSGLVVDNLLITVASVYWLSDACTVAVNSMQYTQLYLSPTLHVADTRSA